MVHHSMANQSYFGKTCHLNVLSHREKKTCFHLGDDVCSVLQYLDLGSSELCRSNYRGMGLYAT